MKTVKIKAIPPLLADSANKTHVSTSWDISLSPDFSITSKIVLSLSEDTEKLIYLEENIDTENNVIYARIKFHFSDGGESSWSNSLPISLEETKLKLSDVIVNTPIVETNIIVTDGISKINITTSKFSLYHGVNEHVATTWEIIDSDNNTIFKRRDNINLLSLTLDDRILDTDKPYYVRVTHHSANNTDSNYGRAILNNDVNEVNLFELISPYTLVPNRWLYLELILYTDNFNSVDIMVSTTDGIVLYENNGQTTTTPNIYVGDININKTYVVMGRIKLTTVNGSTYSNYVEVYRGKPILNEVVPRNLYTNYLDKYTYTQEFVSGGNSIQSATEMYDGSILLHNGTNITRHITYNGKLVDTGEILPNTANYPSPDPVINTIPMSNGRVLVEERIVRKIGQFSPYRNKLGLNGVIGTHGDIEVVSDGGFNTKIEYGTQFTLYKYNVITKKYNFLSKKIFDNAYYGTAINNSIVEINSVVYFIFNTEVIPEYEYSRIKPYFYNIDISGDSLYNVRPCAALPNTDDEVNIRGNYNIFKLDNQTIGLANGSSEVIDNPDTTTHEPEAVRLSDKIYTYSCTDDIFYNNPVTVTGVIPDNVFSLSSNIRKDGKIIFFNAVTSGTGIGNQDTYIYDPGTRIMSKIENDTIDNMAYNSTIYLRSGDLLRMSNRTLDPQLVYTYVSNTYSESDLVNNDTIDRIVSLVVPVGETVNIDNPYKYGTIDIEGTSDTNTGILIWTDEENNTQEYKWNDLLVPNNRTISSDATYDEITVLEGAVLLVI